MKCTHTRTKTILTPELIHYGKLMCEGCGRFIKWVSAPGALPYKERCAELVKRCLEKEPSAFAYSCKHWLETYGYLSPKQYKKLEQLITNPEIAILSNVKRP